MTNDQAFQEGQAVAQKFHVAVATAEGFIKMEVKALAEDVKLLPGVVMVSQKVGEIDAFFAGLNHAKALAASNAEVEQPDSAE